MRFLTLLTLSHLAVDRVPFGTGAFDSLRLCQYCMRQDISPKLNTPLDPIRCSQALPNILCCTPCHRSRTRPPPITLTVHLCEGDKCQ
ncbi:hypothetical protein B0H63DRAFT_472778 [Podospora didyma]|uniref:Secreted protein n=1 Tax=Podospora didyma TaxID=330526 RepID=A0AAE0TZR6_9PEZI|nr:hypothetical protein B0H63DRAFT_472778 [Podospora didyma]